LEKPQIPDATELRDASTKLPSQASNLAALKRDSRWLSAFASNVTSQNGEDGIVAKALGLLPHLDHWCVELGAWDGIRFSNTFDLVDLRGYNVVLIEGDAARYHQLISRYPNKDRTTFINTYAGWSTSDSLDQILEPLSISRDFDFLSVDVDGNDWHIWRAMTKFRPKLVLIEYNPTIANCVDFVQPADAHCHQGSSPSALVRLAKGKGYELLAATNLNLLFVDSGYYNLFGIPDNSLEVLRDEEPTHIFFGYDGTVFLSGRLCLPWHPGVQLSARRLQVLPRMLRGHVRAYSLFQKFVYAGFLMLYNPKVALKSIGRWIKKC
jgi:hypothetical protein